VIADFDKRIDEARRIEQDIFRNRKVRIPRKIFLIGREKLSEDKQRAAADLLDKRPWSKGLI
jgi:hypothetical protein